MLPLDFPQFCSRFSPRSDAWWCATRSFAANLGETAQSTQIIHRLNPQSSPENKSETHGVDWQRLGERFLCVNPKYESVMNQLPPHSARSDRRPQDQSGLCMRKKFILKLFPHEVVPVSRLQQRSRAPRSWANDRTTECVPKCRKIHHSGQIPFSSDRDTLLEVFMEKQSNTARRRQRDKQGDHFQGRRGYEHRKKNPWNFCEELEGYPDSCNSN